MAVKKVHRFEKTHGQSHTRFYNIWRRMKQRCLNKNSKGFEHWGGKGISFSSKWNEFEGFYEDMFESYRALSNQEKYSLDRIDNNKDYSFENCRWSTKKEQNRNRGNSMMIEHMGMKKCLSEWAEYLGINRSTLAQRFYVYKWPINKCFYYGDRTKGATWQ